MNYVYMDISWRWRVQHGVLHCVQGYAYNNIREAHLLVNFFNY